MWRQDIMISGYSQCGLKVSGPSAVPGPCIGSRVPGPRFGSRDPHSGLGSRDPYSGLGTLIRVSGPSFGSRDPDSGLGTLIRVHMPGLGFVKAETREIMTLRAVHRATTTRD